MNPEITSHDSQDEPAESLRLRAARLQRLQTEQEAGPQEHGDLLLQCAEEILQETERKLLVQRAERQLIKQRAPRPTFLQRFFEGVARRFKGPCRICGKYSCWRVR